MSKFTDIFIRRPVLATVISLLIFVVGVRAIMDLQIRQFPKIETSTITVTTVYPGASATLVEGFITTPLEKEIAGADGIDYLTSESTDSTSTISAHIKLNFDSDTAFTSIMSKVAEVRNQLPRESEQPIIQKGSGRGTALMYISFSSDKMSPEQITDYISRVIQPKIETVSGVSQANILGGNVFAMRIWLNPRRMAALGVTPSDVSTALQNNNFQSAAGKTEGEYVVLSVNATTDLQTEEGFKNLVIKHSAGSLVRLKDVARVNLGSENYDSAVYFNGSKAVFMSVNAVPDANPLDVITRVKKEIPSIEKGFPPTLKAKVVFDATTYIRASIHEVITTIIEAALIVILVIFLFLGSMRTVLIPIVTIPLSLVGVCGVMLMLGYSINLLTLLALVLAIGMVVDDAIVVVENIYRHIEHGLTPMAAAIKGAREIATPIISMTITLAAVYAPIGFMKGLTGALFKEFAFTLASAVIISGIVALTLSPMMCSKVLTANISEGKLVKFIDNIFSRLNKAYHRWLDNVLHFKPVTLLFAFVVLVSCIFLFTTAQKQLAPTEDQGALWAVATGPEYANLNYMEKFTSQFQKTYKKYGAIADTFTVNGMGKVNSAFSGIILKPWGDRKLSQQALMAKLQPELSHIAGVQVQMFGMPSLPIPGSGMPVDFVLNSTAPLVALYPITEKLLDEARNSGLFLFVTSSLRFNKPELVININRSKAAQLGINMQDIASALAISLGGNYVNRYSMEGRSYKVIPQVGQRFRLNPAEIQQIHIKTENGDLIPLSTVASLAYKTNANSLSHFQQLNSATIQGVLMPGQTLDQGLSFLRTHANKLMTQGMSINYGGQSRQFMKEGSTLMYTFLFSILIIYLVLAAQFESFRDPLVIMTSVPMAICGALLPISWGVGHLTINIYTQIGLITLIGLISKHGILMVDFANHLRRENNYSQHKAIVEAAAIRLRPVLMTTFAMILGVLPLILASGAGAASRFDIGMVIASGMAIGTCFTLFVVPTMYILKGRSILLFLGSVGMIGFVLYYIFYEMNINFITIIQHLFTTKP